MAARLQRRALFAPTLLRYELVSVCLTKVRGEPEKEKPLRRALDLFAGLGIREVKVPTDGLLELARATSLTAHDAAYLWVARNLQAELVTLDARLIRASGKGD